MEKIISRAQRIIDLARLNTPPVIMVNEGRILSDELAKLPRPVVPPTPKTETWQPL